MYLYLYLPGDPRQDRRGEAGRFNQSNAVGLLRQAAGTRTCLVPISIFVFVLCICIIHYKFYIINQMHWVYLAAGTRSGSDFELYLLLFLYFHFCLHLYLHFNQSNALGLL